MPIVTVMSNGQITLPKDVRDRLHLEVGGKIDFRVNDVSGTATLIPIKKRVGDVFGFLQNSGKKVKFSAKGMDQSLGRTFKRKYK